MSVPSIDDIARKAGRDLAIAEQTRAVPAAPVHPHIRSGRVRATLVAATAIIAVVIAGVAIVQALQTPRPTPSIGQIEPVPPPPVTGADQPAVAPLPTLTTPTDSLLILSTDQTIGVVDIDRGTVQTVAHRPTFVAPGDPLVRISTRGDRLVSYAGADMVSLPLDDLADGDPALVGLALYFLPGQDERSVWLIRGRDQLEAELVDVDGNTLIEPRHAPDGAGTPVAAVTDGLVLQLDNGLQIWNVTNNEIVHHIPGATYPLGAHDERIAWCTQACEVATITDTGTGVQQTIHAPDGTTFRGYQGAFSPDGALLAAPLRVQGHERGAGIAIIEPATGEIRVVAREATGTNRGDLGWDATSRWLFFDTETNHDYPASTQLAAWDRTTGTASAIDVELPGALVPFYGFAVAPDAADRS